MQPWRRIAWDLDDWLGHAQAIEGRRASAPRAAAVARHLGLFPAELVAVEVDRALLRSLRRLFVTSHSSLFGRPCRGIRATAPQTPWIVAIDNRLARMDGPSRNAPDDLIGDAPRNVVAA